MSTLSVTDDCVTELGGWDSVWPGVERRLMAAMLRRTGCRMTAEDLVQETAAIVLARAPSMATADDLYRWSRQVAVRLHIDATRKASRIANVPPPDQADPLDVEHAVTQRMRLSAITAAAQRLTPAERLALVTEAPPGAERRVQVKHNVRRLRARARLLQLAGPPGLAGLALPLGVLRRLAGRLPRWARPAVAAIAVPLAVGAMIPLIHAFGPSAPAEPGPVLETRSADPQSLPPAAASPVVTPVVGGGAPHVEAPAAPQGARTVIEPVPGQQVFVGKETIPEDDPRRKAVFVCTGDGTLPVVGPFDDTCVRMPTDLP